MFDTQNPPNKNYILNRLYRKIQNTMNDENSFTIKPVSYQKICDNCCINYTNSKSLSCNIPLEKYQGYGGGNFNFEWRLGSGFGNGHFNFFIDELFKNEDIIDFSAADKWEIELWEDLISQNKNTSNNFSAVYGNVIGLSNAKFLNTESVKRIVYACNGQIIFEMKNLNKDSEISFPIPFFSLNGTMFGTSLFYFEVEIDDFNNDLQISEIPMFLNHKEFCISDILSLCWFEKIPHSSQIDKKNIMVNVHGFISLIHDNEFRFL